jgi:hypothetical protein
MKDREAGERIALCSARSDHDRPVARMLRQLANASWADGFAGSNVVTPSPSEFPGTLQTLARQRMAWAMRHYRRVDHDTGSVHPDPRDLQRHGGIDAGIA